MDCMKYYTVLDGFKDGSFPSAFSRRAVVSYWRKYVHEVLVNRLGGLSLPRKSVVRLTDRPDMTLDVYRGRKTTIQPIQGWFLFQILSRWPTIHCIHPPQTKGMWWGCMLTNCII